MSPRSDASPRRTAEASPSTWVTVWGVFRLVAAGAGVAALVAQLIRTTEIAAASTTPHGSHLLTAWTNFFSFFTVQSNIIAAIALVIGGVWLFTKGRRTAVEPRWIAVLFACVATYMIVTGLVYNILLRGIELPQGQTVPWSNEVLHVWIPVVLLVDLLVSPRRGRLGWGTIGVIVIYPLVWIGYTLIRGPLVTAPGTGQPFWYPYPFLNPNTEAGWPSVFVYMAVIAAVIILVGAGVVAVTRWRGVRTRRVWAGSPALNVSSPPR